MNNDQLNSLIRSGLKIAGAMLVAHGLKDYADILNSADVAGFIIMLGGFLWSHFHHADGPATPKTTLLAIAFAGALALGGLGCASTPQQIAYRSAGTTAVSVETAMRGYNVWAAQGNTTPEQNAKVKALYEKYQQAFAVACDAGAIYAASSTTNSAPALAAFTQAQANASQELTDLVNLIRSFGVKI